MDAEVRAALLTIAVGVPAVLVVAYAYASPRLGRLALAAVVFVAVAAYALVVGLAIR